MFCPGRGASVGATLVVAVALVTAGFAGVVAVDGGSPAGVARTATDEPSTTADPSQTASEPPGAASTTARTAAAGENRTITGVAVAYGAYEPQLRQLATEAAGVAESTSTNAFALFAGGETYVVLTDRDPASGVASVTGRVLAAPNESTTGIVNATSVTLRTTGNATPVTDVRERPSSLRGQLVATDGPYRQAGHVIGTNSSVAQTRSYGLAGGGQRGDLLLEYPGFVAQDVVNSETDTDVQRLLGRVGETNIQTGSFEPSFWIDAPAQVDSVVMHNESWPLGPQTWLLVSGVAIQSRTLDDLDALRERGDELAGEVVTVETDVIGRQLSTRRIVADTEQCGPTSRYYNATDRCAQIASDVTVHAGVLSDGAAASWDDVVPYAGLSNHVQRERSAPENGSYRVTGRVVPVERLDPRLGGEYALFVYDRERVGTVASSSADDVRPWQRAVTDAVAWQANATQEEFRALVEFAAGDEEGGVEIVAATLNSSTVAAGDPLRVTVRLENTAPGDRTIVLRLRENDTLYDIDDVTVPGGATRNATLEFAVHRSGEHALAVNNRSVGTVTVLPSNTTATRDGDGGGLLSPGQPAPGVAAAVVALVLGALVLRRRARARE